MLLARWIKMKELIYFLVYDFVEMFFWFLFLISFFEIRISKINFAAVSLGLYLVQILAKIFLENHAIFVMAIFSILSAAVFIFLCKGSATKKLLFALFYIAVQDVFAEFFYLILYFSKADTDIYHQSVELLSIVIAASLYILIYKKWQIRETHPISNIGAFLFLLMVLTFMGYINSVASDLENLKLMIGIDLFSLGMVLFLYSFLYLYSKNMHEKRIKDSLEQKIKIEREHYQLLEEYNDKTRMIRHDIKHLLTELYHMKDSDRDLLLKKKLKELEKGKNKLYTRHAHINYLLNEKLGQIEIPEEKVEIICDVPLTLPMEHGDLGVLLGNVFDNMIEALIKIPVEERECRILVFKEDQLLKIKVSNTFESIEENFQTSKKDKENHGFGLKSISEITKRYKGVLNIKTEGSIFSIDIVLPLFLEERIVK